MFPDVEIAEKANARSNNGGGQSIQGRANPAPWETVPGVGFFGDTMLVQIAQVADEFPAWSIYPQVRDRRLREFYRASDGALASAIFTMQSKLGSLPYKINAPGPRSKKRFSDLVGYSEFGEGFAALLKKTATDLYTQDNGWFWELMGAGRVDRPLRGPVLQIAHLDPGNCWRTFDSEVPVLYTNPYPGQWHKIHESRVVMGSSFPQTEELARGVGLCAVSRALRWAQFARDIIVYKHEKAAGRFTRALGWTVGFTEKSFEGALEQAAEKNDARGFTRYAMIPFMHSMKDGASINKLDLASLPDGFDSLTEQDLWIYLLAFAFGVDAREFWPATASGATKADATIQNMKAQGKGFADDVKTIEHAINWKIFPDGVSLEFDNKDDEQDKKVADLHAVHTWNVQTNITSGVITPLEGRAILISKGVIDPDVLKDVAKPVLADDTAPVDLESDTTVNDETPAPNTVEPVQPPAPPGGNRGGPNITPVRSPVGSKEEPEKPVIKGSPLPPKEATKVEPFTEGEIDDMFDLYSAMAKKVKRSA